MIVVRRSAPAGRRLGLLGPLHRRRPPPALPPLWSIGSFCMDISRKNDMVVVGRTMAWSMRSSTSFSVAEQIEIHPDYAA
jgi:hypothetical protein